MSDPEGYPNITEMEKTAAAVLLRSMKEYGITHIYGNFGTDHPPLLESAAVARTKSPDEIPQFITCPHESVALSAAHGHAIATGDPQAVLVHVDVGTQNLGAMVHNAHRGNAPVFIIAGLAPVSSGDHPGSRTERVHFLQDIYDQKEIVEQFCKWTNEYRPPADPDEYIARGLELASTPRKGPVYMTATREALETTVPSDIGSRQSTGTPPSVASDEKLQRIACKVNAAETPLVLTSKVGVDDPHRSVQSLVDFAETAGAGVVEVSSAALCFPRDHDLHVGFSTTDVLSEADLLLLVDIDVPWMPDSESAPPADVPVVHLDIDPEKSSYPQWDFQTDITARCDPVSSLAILTQYVNQEDGAAGRQFWRSVSQSRRTKLDQTLDSHEENNRLTPVVLSNSIRNVINDSTVIVNETTTNSGAVERHTWMSQPGNYYTSHGSGLGWATGAAIGVKLGRPDSRVISLVGDGSYVFGQPTASAWTASAFDAPTLTVIYNNAGWNAVRKSTLNEHPNGSSERDHVPESRFDPRMDLAHAANVVDAYTNTVTTVADLDNALEDALREVDGGRPAVVDVHLEPI